MPLFLSRSRPTYGTVIDHNRRLVRGGLIPPVKDVCEKCNGGVLSRLDTYASGLDRSYFTKIAGPSARIEFRYDFKSLLRWLFKLTYNDDRTRPPPYETKLFVPFILGEVRQPPLATSILLGILTTDGQDHMNSIAPENYGLGYLGGFDWSVALARFVQINSYFFSLFAWQQGVSRQVRRRLLTEFCRESDFSELRAGNECVRVSGSMDYASFRRRVIGPVHTYEDRRS